MAIVLLAACGSVIAGLALAWLGIARPVVLLPIRSFAIASLLATVALHLLPEAIEQAGPWVLLVFLGSLVLPSVWTWVQRTIIRRNKPHHQSVVIWLSVVGVLIHQLSDGIALGSFNSGYHDHVHWDLVVGIAAHTVPLTAVVVLPLGKRASFTVTVAMIVAVVAGTVIARQGAASFEPALPWLNAIIAGLVLHVLAHDTSAVRRTVRLRSVELLAIFLGFATIVAVSANEHHGESSTLLPLLKAHALRAAPLVLLGLATTVLFRRFAKPMPTWWLGQHGGRTGALRGLMVGSSVPSCTCESLPLAMSLFHRGASPAAAIAFLLVVPELGFDTYGLSAQWFGWKAATLRTLFAVLIAVGAASLIHRSAGHSHASEMPRQCEPVGTLISETIIHVGPWMLAGVVAAAFADFALTDYQIVGFGSWLTDMAAACAIAMLAYACAPAATPLAGALASHGLHPAIAMSAVGFGAMVNRANLGWLRETIGIKGAVSIAAIALLGHCVLAAALGNLELVTFAALPTDFGVVAWGAAAVLTALIFYSLWRHGLGAWIEPLVGSEHSHHHH